MFFIGFGVWRIYLDLHIILQGYRVQRQVIIPQSIKFEFKMNLCYIDIHVLGVTLYGSLWISAGMPSYAQVGMHPFRQSNIYKPNSFAC